MAGWRVCYQWGLWSRMREEHRFYKSIQNSLMTFIEFKIKILYNCVVWCLKKCVEQEIPRFNSVSSYISVSLKETKKS